MTKSKPQSGGPNQTPPKLRHESPPAPPATEWALRVILVANLILIPLALFAMGEESGPIASLKYLTVGFAAAAAAYGVNRFAIDRLAPLHAIGFRLAGAAAIAGILIVGAGTALGSLTGLIYGAVEARIYQTSEQAVTRHIGLTNDLALGAARIAPLVEGVAQDMERTISCEVRAACLSGTTGGRGPMTRALEIASGEAFGIAEALQAGVLERERLLDDLNGLGADYRALLADETRSLKKRRPELQSLHADVVQRASALREAMPMGLVRAYAADLQAGASIAGDPLRSRALSTYLRDHGQTLADQLGDLPVAEIEAPTFPARPGMLEVLNFIPAFLAIAAIVIVGELCLPLIMYLMAWLKLSWAIERREEASEDQAKPEDGFDGLLDPVEPHASLPTLKAETTP